MLKREPRFFSSKGANNFIIIVVDRDFFAPRKREEENGLISQNPGGSGTKFPSPVQEVMRSNLGYGLLESELFLGNQLAC